MFVLWLCGVIFINLKGAETGPFSFGERGSIPFSGVRETKTFKNEARRTEIYLGIFHYHFESGQLPCWVEMWCWGFG